ncbi:MAG: hypothetical protein COZ15_04840 [Elusimicrobia bacterium CG_4_10_14_3_um_filter_49_12_50_7]|nr:MAG: hypothetical protein COS41_05605 [Elusimicrobia bacterium CG03_land_8_20_14_0_80_50_18]PIX15223.1 MAG: hypothetical protein COZ72_04015 [Elusimicrobia bacterium CG_4_8_14_3_um_filter_50_9]PIY16662.1 MAG: hypothetical protein COZ15_04840 [Elusimicrobia bacterium CG_4_10_14_3_um_filter_49_12_50_7]
MWLIMTSLAAIITTAIWYINAPNDKYKLGLLSLIFWGATIMWFVDAVMAHLIDGEDFFEITPDAALLGLAVIILALTVWEIALLLSDPKKIFKNTPGQFQKS